MDRKTDKRPWIRKIVIAAVVAEFCYLVIFNLALQLPYTQSLINQLRPERFTIVWGNAWTLYPFRFHIRNASGNGQSRNQQWEFDAKSVSASIDVLPLFFHRVWIDRVRVSDASYFQRPRLKPDKDYTELLEFYPAISNRELTAAVITPAKKKEPWHVDIEDIRLDGQFEYWVNQFKGRVAGTLDADLDVVSRGGLLSMRVPDIDFDLEPHYINGMEFLRRGKISGELGLSPFVPRENKGAKLFQFLLIDADIDIQVNSLAFMDRFTRNFKGMNMKGAGRVDGHLRVGDGRMLDGTGILINADNLNVGLLTHMISGNGTVGVEVGPDTGGQFKMDVRFSDLSMHHGGGEPLFTGMGLSLDYRAASDLFQPKAEKNVEDSTSSFQQKPFELYIKIPTSGVADMSVFNYYLPPDTPFSFIGGTADLTADIQLKPGNADGYLKLVANNMLAQIDDQSISADFKADFLLVGGLPEQRLFDISGTELQFGNVMLTGGKGKTDQKEWQAVMTFSKAELTITKPLSLKTEAELSMTDSRPIVALLGVKKDRPNWVKNRLLVEGVTGAIKMDMADNRVRIPSAFVNSDNIDFGAKGIIHEGMSDGVIYARYKKLDILVKYSNGERNIDLVRAKHKFDEYQLPAAHEQRETLPLQAESPH